MSNTDIPKMWTWNRSQGQAVKHLQHRSPRLDCAEARPRHTHRVNSHCWCIDVPAGCRLRCCRCCSTLPAPINPCRHVPTRHQFRTHACHSPHDPVAKV